VIATVGLAIGIAGAVLVLTVGAAALRVLRDLV
jgi:hypothetical protein